MLEDTLDAAASVFRCHYLTIGGQGLRTNLDEVAGVFSGHYLPHCYYRDGQH